MASAKEAKASRGIPPAHEWVHSLPGESELPHAGTGPGARMGGAFELMNWAGTIAHSLGRGSACATWRHRRVTSGGTEARLSRSPSPDWAP